jgi:tetratricopeptide (TPR) repeat protein
MSSLQWIFLVCFLSVFPCGCLVKTVKPVHSRILTAAEARERSSSSSETEDTDPASLKRAHLENVEAALKEEPGNPKWHFELGLLYERAGEFDRAEQLYRSGSELVDPRYTGPDFLLGRLLVKQGRLDDGLRVLNRIVKLEPASAHEAIRNPHFRETHYLIGVCLYLKDDRNASKRAFRSYLRLGGQTGAVIRYFPSLVAG